MIVAEITKDVLYNKWNREGGEYNSQSHIGKQFDSEALRQWWSWGILEYGHVGTAEDTYFIAAESNSGKIRFKLYDDDDELYYEGWLIDDDECIVQQFVLAWAQYDSGCTTIMVHKNAEAGYIQEIG